MHPKTLSMNLLLLTLVVMSMIYLLASQTESLQVAVAVNSVLPPLLMVVLLGVAYRLVRRNPEMLWTPLPWFLSSCALYFCFGPLIYSFGTADAVKAMNQVYRIDEGDILRTNTLDTIAIATVLGTFRLAFRALDRKVSTRVPVLAQDTVQQVAVVFLSVGLPIKLLLALPFEFGMLSFVPPGSIIALKFLVPLALIPLTILAFTRRRHWIWMLILAMLLVLEILVSILEFSKMAFIVDLLMIEIGWFMTGQKSKSLWLGFVLIFAAYWLITPLIPFGRGEILRKTGNIQQANLSDRFEILGRYFSSPAEEIDIETSSKQAWWARLSYTSAQAFVLRAYDQGRSGDSFLLSFIAVVPRIFWTDKPMISNVGMEFNDLLSGNMDTSNSPGVFAEAYWNGGWLMVIFACSILGLLFAVMSRYSLRAMAGGKLAYLPIIFIGIIMGLRPDGWFVVEYVQAPALALVLHPFLGFLYKTIVSHQRRRR